MDAALRGAAARLAQRRHTSFADTVETALEELEGALPPATVFLGMLEDGGSALRVMDLRGQPIAGLAAGDELRVGTEDAVPRPEPLRELGVQSFIGVPLETSDGLQAGSLCVAADETGLFDEEHFELVTVIARVLALETELVRSRAEVQRLAELVRDPRGTHPQSGLPDRVQMLDWLRRERALSRRGTHISHLVTCRLEGIRAVRAQFGEAVADLLIKDAAETLQGTVRDSDHCAHVGDGMFAAVLVGCETAESAGRFIARFQGVLARVADSRPVSFKLAFGIRTLDDPASPEEALVAAEMDARGAEAVALLPEPVGAIS